MQSLTAFRRFARNRNAREGGLVAGALTCVRDGPLRIATAAELIAGDKNSFVYLFQGMVSGGSSAVLSGRDHTNVSQQGNSVDQRASGPSVYDQWGRGWSEIRGTHSIAKQHIGCALAAEAWAPGEARDLRKALIEVVGPAARGGVLIGTGMNYFIFGKRFWTIGYRDLA